MDEQPLTVREFLNRFQGAIIRIGYGENDAYETWVGVMQQITGRSMVTGTLNFLDVYWDHMTSEQHVQIFAAAALLFRNDT